MKTIICILRLGQTRICGYVLYEEANHEFQETTPMVTKELIIKGQVNGLKIVNGNIELDEEGFNIRNLMIKSAVGKYRSLYPTAGMMMSSMYAVVRVIEMNNEKLYELISNKCAKFKFNYEQLKGLIEIGGYVAGVRMINEEIVVCKGVTFIDNRSEVEHLDNRCSTEDSVVKSCIDIDKQGISDIKTKAKTGKTVRSNKNTASEKVKNLETIFDTIDVTKLTSDEKSSNTDNTTENNHDRLTQEHTENKIKMSVRKKKIKL